MSAEPHGKPWPFTAKMIAEGAEYSSQKSMLPGRNPCDPEHTLTKKLAETKGEECNLWKFPKKELPEVGIFPSHCHSPLVAQILARGKRCKQFSSKITTWDMTEANIMHYLHCKALAVVFQQAKQGKKET